MNSSCCSRYCALLVQSLFAFAFIFAFDFLFHGKFMMPMYIETAALWRKQEAMEALCPFSAMVQFFTAFTITWIFSRNYERKGLGEGVRFGLMIGLLMGIMHAGCYSYMPIPAKMAIFWLIGGVAQGIGVGALLAFTFGKCKRTQEACLKQ